MSNVHTGVLITGTVGGIGRALCEAFRAAGYRVVATDRSGTQFADHSFLPLDLVRLVDDESVRSEFRCQVLEVLGDVPLGVLVNNAAVQTLGPVHGLSLAAFRHSMDINLTAPLALIASFLDVLSAQRGVAINIGSVHA